MAKSFAQFVPEIAIHVSECPSILIELAVRQAAIDFCHASRIYRTTVSDMDTVAGERDYGLVLPPDTTIVALEWLTLDGGDLEVASSRLLSKSDVGTPTHGYATGALLHLSPTPLHSVVGVVSAEVSVKPTHAATELPDEVVNDYNQAIIDGALARLLRIPGKAWTDPNAAGDYFTLFEAAAHRALAQHGKRGRITRTVRYGGY